MAFTGWPEAAFDLYRRLEVENSRAFWLANKAIYDSSIKTPFAELSMEVERKYGVMHLFRPHRDVRFSKDKSPYKTAAGAVAESDGGAAYYAQVSSAGLFVGCGMYTLDPGQLDRWRRGVFDDRTGPAIAKIVAALRSNGYEIGAMDALKTAPRGYDKDHPRIELLRLKGLTMGKSFSVAKWLSTPKALGRVCEVWDDAKAMNAWLGKHVGPSTEAPPEPD